MRVIALLATILGLSLIGCLSGQAQAQSQSAQPTAGDVLSVYRLGPGDKIRILVFGETSLTGEFVVGGTGTVALPLIGEIPAKGFTVTEFQRSVERALSDGYLKDPRVSIEVANYRPFYILGEVSKPGEYPYTNGLTVLNAVATANGFTYRADAKHVYIRRATATSEQRVDLTTQTSVFPGDTIRIGERMF